MGDPKFDLLEKKLNIASSLIDELDDLDIEICDVELPELTSIVTTDIVISDDNLTTEVFSTGTLKTDFALIRQNVMALISTGQRIVNSASVIDVSDMTPAYLKSMSELQQTLGNNLKLLIDLYTQIANIEKTRDRNKDKKVGSEPAVINKGTITNNNNLVFTGSTEELLTIIKNNTNSKDQPKIIMK